MKLRQRALLYIAVAIVCITGASFFLRSRILLSSFQDLETRESILNTKRAADAVNALPDTIAVKAGDWGVWDQSYQFMADKNKRFIKENLLGDILIDIDMMLFVDDNGREFHARPIPREGSVHPMKVADLLKRLGLGDPAQRSKVPLEGLSGFILLPSGPALVSVRPILSASRKGPPRGFIVFGRYADKKLFDSVGSRTHLDLQTYLVSDTAMPADYKAALASFAKTETPTIPLDSQWTAGYTLVRDIFGKPMAVVRIKQHRDILTQGRRSSNYLLIQSIVVGIVFGIVIILILEVSALSRLSKLSAQVAKVDESNEDFATVSLGGRDELTSLATGINGMLLKLRDSRSQLRQNNANLARTVEKLAASNQVLENALDGIARLAVDGTIMSANHAFSAILGAQHSQVIGQHWSQFVVDEDHNLFESALARAQSMDRTEQELRFRTEDGKTLFGQLGILIQEADDRGNATVHLFLRDVSDAKAAEQANHDKLLAQEANEAKSAFLSRMSHELRTPLNAILGFSQLLQLELDSPKHQEMLTHLMAGGKHLVSLINEVLDISRIESNNFSVSLEPVQVNFIIEEAASLVRPLAMNQQVTMAIDAPEELWVRADAQRLRQCVLNLLSNAIKYNRVGGTVTIRVRSEDSGVTMSVIDTGPGIAPEFHHRLFTPFDRLGAEQSETQGTGLGLALTRRLVECMSGRIWMENAPEGGAIFSIGLHQDQSPCQVHELQPEKAVQTSTTRPTVLYIEDNFSNAHLMESVAERLGFTLITATHGRLGFEQAIALLPDLILLDLDLPDVQGTEVLDLLKATPKTAQIPVVIVSADASQRRIDRLMKGGALAYISKPFEISEIAAVVFPKQAA